MVGCNTTDDYCRIAKVTPAINWKEYFTGIGFTKLDSVIVSQPKYMKACKLFSQNNVVA
jgi:endothelin-converting enzyme/putative endopeptidase